MDLARNKGDLGMPGGSTSTTVSSVLSDDSKERKETPLYSGLLQYFPRALAAVARVSHKGNEKHNPGQPLHWSRGKSADHEDCVVRHMVTPYNVDTDGELHIAHAAWRALAACEIALEKLESDRVTARLEQSAKLNPHARERGEGV
jgi:hypothetical protein